MQKNTYYLKAQVYKLLSQNSALELLLGADDRIHFQHPNKNVAYPQLIYSIIDDLDVPYDEDRDFGQVTETLLGISFHDNSESSRRSDDVDACVKGILNNNNNYVKDISLTSEHIICYSGMRVGHSGPEFDPEARLWVTTSSYRITWAMRDMVSREVQAQAYIS